MWFFVQYGCKIIISTEHMRYSFNFKDYKANKADLLCDGFSNWLISTTGEEHVRFGAAIMWSGGADGSGLLVAGLC